jgi:pantothenate kinase
MDGFHLSNAQLELLGLADLKGSPATFDVAGLVSLLTRIRSLAPDDELCAPAYDRVVHDPIAARIRITATTRLVIVEGNYLLLDRPGWREVARLLDASWYLDVPADLRRRRLIERHIAGGKTPQDASSWVAAVDEPNAELIAATRPRATYATDATRLDAELSQLAQP